MKPLLKQPAETGAYVIPFAGSLPAGASLASITSVAQAPAGRVNGAAALTIADQQVAGSDLQLRIGGGTSGELYTLTATVTDNAGGTHQVDVDLIVVDLGSYLPGAQGSYLDPRGYVDRFGYEETSVLADRYRTGRIDPDALHAALGDADAIINSHLQSRFELPLQSAPRLLVQLAGDIARYFLHRDNAPDVVRERYKEAVRQLERIADGKMHLGLNQGGEQVATDGGVGFTAPGRIFTRDTLKGY